MNDGWAQHRFAPAPGTALCNVADIPDGGGLEVTCGLGKDAFRLAVFRQGAEVYAYVNRCPHFGIPLNAGAFVTAQRRVFCVNHYARFRIRDGYCEDGPCQGASLDAVPVILRDGLALVGESSAWT